MHVLQQPGLVDRIVLALLECDSRGEAARQAGVSLSTIRRLLVKPEFVERLEEVRQRLMDARVGRLLEPEPVAECVR